MSFVANPWPVLGWRGPLSATRKFLKPSDKRGIGYGGMKEAYAGDAMEMMCPTCLTPRDPEKKSVSSASPRRMRSTALSRWRAWWWMANFGSFALRQMAPTTGRLRVWPRKRRMQPWWTSPLWPNRPHPAWTPKRLLLLTKFLNHSASSWETKWWQTHQILPCWKPWPSARSDHTSSRRKIRMRVRRFSTLGRPRRWSWGRPHSVIPSNLQRLTWPRWRKQSHWRQKSLGRCRLGLWVWQTKRLWEPRCSDSWTWSTTKSAWRGATWTAQGCRLKPASKKPGNRTWQCRLVGRRWQVTRSAFEQNVFAPEFEMDDAMAIDHEAVITEYKEMKGFLQSSNTRQFAPKLYPELPETPVKELDLDGTMVGPTHPAFKLALLTRMCNHHFGELRQFGGVWRLAYGRFNPPKWAKQLKREELIALETRTHPADLRNWNYTEEDVKKQVEAGLRPAPQKIRGGFWAPYDEERYWQRQTQTWTLPALFHVYGNGWTMKELYGIWCEMPLMIQRSRRGQGETAKEHQANLQKTKDEVQQFLDANNLERPQSPAEWRQCYRELGKFLAMRAFLTNTPQVVMEIPVAPITDDREHMIMRAICDERISLPLDAFKEHPEIYDQIVAILPADQLMDVKVAWRCNTTQYWHAEVDAAAAGPLYAKLGYSAAAIEAMDLNPFGGHVNLTAQGAKILGEEPAHSGHPNPGERQSGHSPAPFITIEGDDGKDYDAERKPPITVNNVVSACGKDYMRKSYPGGKRYAFWGRMECGLVLSSVSPWEMVQKEKGVTRGGYCCKWCKGFWKGKMGSSRFLQITSANVVLQMVLDEPPERLYNRWVKDRIEFYKRLEPTAPLRDVPLKVDPNPVHRLRFSISNGLGNVSDAIWNIVLANPEKAGLEGIHHVADKHIGTECIRGGHPYFAPFVFALRLMRPPGCTLILLQQGGPRRELIATSLWEPTGWINRHLPGIDPRPMTGKKCRAAGSLSVIFQLGSIGRISFVILIWAFTLGRCCMCFWLLWFFWLSLLSASTSLLWLENGGDAC